jgi:hypothetical protein
MYACYEAALFTRGITTLAAFVRLNFPLIKNRSCFLMWESQINLQRTLRNVDELRFKLMNGEMVHLNFQIKKNLNRNFSSLMNSATS